MNITPNTKIMIYPCHECQLSHRSPFSPAVTEKFKAELTEGHINSCHWQEKHDDNYPYSPEGCFGTGVRCATAAAMIKKMAKDPNANQSVKDAAETIQECRRVETYNPNDVRSFLEYGETFSFPLKAYDDEKGVIVVEKPLDEGTKAAIEAFLEATAESQIDSEQAQGEGIDWLGEGD